MLPDLSVLWVIGFVLLITAIVNRLLFKPLTAVMQAREEAVGSARRMAESAAEQARASAEEFEARTRSARGEVYARMEAARQEAQAHRSALLAEARAQAVESTERAARQLQSEVADARARLDQDADALASAIAERVLGRQTT